MDIGEIRQHWYVEPLRVERDDDRDVLALLRGGGLQPLVRPGPAGRLGSVPADRDAQWDDRDRSTAG